MVSTRDRGRRVIQAATIRLDALPQFLQLDDPEPRRQPARSRLVRAAILLAFAALTLQLWRLQLVDGRRYTTAAADNRLRVTNVPPLRGLIYDRNLAAIAVNAPMFVLTVTEADLPSARRSQVLEETARILGGTADEIDEVLQSKRGSVSPFTPIPIRGNVPRDVVLALEEHSWALPGVSVQTVARREYPPARSSPTSSGSWRSPRRRITVAAMPWMATT